MDNRSYECQGCGATVTRQPTRGQRPKWCGDCRDRHKRETVCADCGQTFTSTYRVPTCSSCRADLIPGKRHHYQRKAIYPAAPPKDRRSPLRKAFEDGTPLQLLAAIRERCHVEPSGCWIWQGTLKHGYAQVVLGSRTRQVHRLSLETWMRADLGSQAAHHKCANPACVNPEHLQPVTHRENVAEMMARQAYRSRIRELEEALMAAAPDHPLLTVVRVA